MVHTLHVEQHPDNAVGAVLGERVGPVVGVVLQEGLRLLVGCCVRDLGAVAVVEVPGWPCFGGAVTLPLAFPPTFSARVYDVVAYSLYTKAKLGNAANWSQFLGQLFQDLEVLLVVKTGLCGVVII